MDGWMALLVMSLRKLREMVKNRKAWRAVVYCKQSDTTEQLNNNNNVCVCVCVCVCVYILSFNFLIILMIVILKCQGNYEQNENTIHRMGENICNLSDQKGINL